MQRPPGGSEGVSTKARRVILMHVMIRLFRSCPESFFARLITSRLTVSSLDS